MNTNTSKEPSEEQPTEESVKAVCYTCYGAGGSLYGGPCKECGQPPTAQPTTKPDNVPAGEVDLERLEDALVNVPGLPWAEGYEIVVDEPR